MEGEGCPQCLCTLIPPPPSLSLSLSLSAMAALPSLADVAFFLAHARQLLPPRHEDVRRGRGKGGPLVCSSHGPPLPPSASRLSAAAGHDRETAGGGGSPCGAALCRAHGCRGQASSELPVGAEATAATGCVCVPLTRRLHSQAALRLLWLHASAEDVEAAVTAVAPLIERRWAKSALIGRLYWRHVVLPLAVSTCVRLRRTQMSSSLLIRGALCRRMLCARSWTRAERKAWPKLKLRVQLEGGPGHAITDSLSATGNLNHARDELSAASVAVHCARASSSFKLRGEARRPGTASLSVRPASRFCHWQYQCQWPRASESTIRVGVLRY